MSELSIAETLDVIAPYKEKALADYLSSLDYHHGGHVENEMAYLVMQWGLCDLYGIPVDKIETGIAWFNHDRGFGEKGHSGFGCKEARSAYMIECDLTEEGWTRERIAKVTRPIMATWLEGKITDVNDLIVVRTDLHNIWEDYLPMAANALRLRREEEGMCGEPMTFDEFKQRIEFRLGDKYLARDMALVPYERDAEGKSIPNLRGYANLRRFLDETPESLASALDISPTEIE